MALTIGNYRPPGAYSSIIPNPTTTTAAGLPVVAIIGQALRGVYEPTLFNNLTDPEASYGVPTKGNPLSLGIEIAFANGSPQVLGLNVKPDNNTPAYINIALNSLPVSSYTPAGNTVLDAVTGLSINPGGNVVGTFYVEDFNAAVKDPVYNASPAAAAAEYALAGTTSMLQYEKLLGYLYVPLANTQQQQVIIYTVPTSTTPVTSITQNQWNQFLNAQALFNAFNGAYQSPVSAEFLIPDSSQTGYNPIPGYTDLYGAIGRGLGGTPQINAGGSNPTTITNSNDAYSYAVNHGGILRVSALDGGTQHQILLGLFDTNLASPSSTNSQALGLAVQNGGAGNPFAVFSSGTDGVVTDNSYLNAINQLESVRADIIVVLNTSPAIQAALQTHCVLMSNVTNRNERIGITSGPISELYATTISNVTALQGGAGGQRMVYIWPTSIYRFDQILETTVALDGTYAACACAGILASYDAATPLTHKVLTGFRDVGVHTTETQMNTIAAYGISIIENHPTFGLRVRHGLTCDPTSAETQEISVVRQLDFTAQALRDEMEANIIAKKIGQGTLGAVTSLGTSVLQGLKDADIIYGFKNLTARINPSSPVTIDLMVSVRPAYPCDYVNITIAVTSSLDGF